MVPEHLLHQFDFEAVHTCGSAKWVRMGVGFWSRPTKRWHLQQEEEGDNSLSPCWWIFVHVLEGGSCLMQGVTRRIMAGVTLTADHYWQFCEGKNWNTNQHSKQCYSSKLKGCSRSSFYQWIYTDCRRRMSMELDLSIRARFAVKFQELLRYFLWI